MTNDTNTTEDIFDEVSSWIGGSSAIGDPYPVFAERRSVGAVGEGDILSEFGVAGIAQSVPDAPQFTVFGYDQILEVFRQPSHFSNEIIRRLFAPMLGEENILGLDGPRHRSWRGLLAPAFTRKLILEWQSELMRPIANDLVAEHFAGKRSANLMDFAVRFPVQMIYRVLGLPPGPGTYDDFSRATLEVALGTLGVNPDEPEQAAKIMARSAQATQNLYDAILPIVAERRAQGAEPSDLIGRLLLAEFEGESLTDDQIAVFVRSLMIPASETTARSWANAMTCVLERPEVLDELRADPSLIPKAIDEALRFQPAATVVVRLAVQDHELAGVQIPAGSVVTLAVASGNRDEKIFDNPDVYDIHREGPSTLSFGYGPHVCVGQYTAKAEMAEAMRALLETLPNLRLDPDKAAPEIVGMNLRTTPELNVVWDA